MIGKKLLLALMIALFHVGAFGQSKGGGQESGSHKLYTKLYNNLYSQTDLFNSNGDKMPDTSRRSFITNILEVAFMNERRLWFGFDAYLRASKRHDIDDSPFQVLSYENNGLNATAKFSQIGPKLIWRPRAKNQNFYTKFLLLLPLDNKAQNISAGIPTLDNTGTQLWIQAAYNAKLAEKLYAYIEITAVNRWGRKVEPKSDFFVPLKSFFSYFPLPKVGIFGFSDFTPTISNPTSFYLQLGGGVKVFPSDNFEIELSGSKFLVGKSVGAGYTINLGVSYIYAN